ncbi:MAG: CCA tRNA nucleotidyltransferase [Solobacterium sp.]|nr:CCA tRNA nucleotidyltransferase [Solobacterium sp.]
MKFSEEAVFIVKTLRDHGTAFVVGGCVRDKLMGVDVHDEDITTSILPQKVSEIFKELGYPVIPTGIKHGTVTVLINRKPYEITTYRIDGNYTDGRHPDSISFTADVKDDLARRDFTINAIAYDPVNDEIIDPYHGIDDIKNKIVRAVGDPNDRIAEDRLRMMRAVRFAAEKGMVIEPGLYRAVRNYAHEITSVSAERIGEELHKMMTGRDPREALVLLHRTRLLEAFAPELDILFDTPQNNPHHIYDAGHHTAAVLKDIESTDDVLRFAALFHDAGKAAVRTTDEKGIDHFYGHPAVSAKIAHQVMKRLKYSNRLIDGTVLLVKHHEEIGDPKMNMAKYLFRNQDIASPDIMKQLFILRRADVSGQNPDTWQKKYDDMDALEQKLARITVFSEKDLAVNGNDLIGYLRDRGIVLKGHDVGLLKNSLLHAVMVEKEENTKEHLLAICEKRYRMLLKEKGNS